MTEGIVVAQDETEQSRDPRLALCATKFVRRRGSALRVVTASSITRVFMFTINPKSPFRHIGEDRRLFVISMAVSGQMAASHCPT